MSLQSLNPFWIVITLFARSQHPSVKLLARLCLASIVICSGTLALVMAIMAGFNEATRYTLKGWAPDIIIEAPARKRLSAKDLVTFLRTTYPAAIAEVMTQSHMTVLLQHPDNTRDISNVISLHVVDDPRIMLRRLPKLATAPGNNNSQSPPTGIIIDKHLRESLNVKDHENIIIRYPASQQRRSSSLALESITVPVSSVPLTSLGAEGHDEAIISSESLRHAGQTTIQPSSVAIYLQPSHLSRTLELARDIQRQTHLVVRAWEEGDPTYQAALQLEHAGMSLILVLLLMLTGIAISSLVAVQVIHREHDLAVLIAMGLTPAKLHRYAVATMTLLSAMATILGLAVATCISCSIDAYHLVPLPNVYYVDHLPAHMSIHILLACFALSIVVTVCASLIPLQTVRTMSIYRLLAGR